MDPLNVLVELGSSSKHDGTDLSRMSPPSSPTQGAAPDGIGICCQKPRGWQVIPGASRAEMFSKNYTCIRLPARGTGTEKQDQFRANELAQRLDPAGREAPGRASTHGTQCRV